jgi:hypothetical protein
LPAYTHINAFAVKEDIIFAGLNQNNTVIPLKYSDLKNYSIPENYGV